MVLSFGPLGRDLLVFFNLALLVGLSVPVVGCMHGCAKDMRDRAVAERAAAGEQPPEEPPESPTWIRVVAWAVMIAAALVLLMLAIAMAHGEWALLERWGAVESESFDGPAPPSPPGNEQGETGPQ